MRIPSGKTDQSIYFYAADATDLVTAETGLSSFTVYRSRNGGTATAYTTPTVSELSSANMPGLYRLLIDEDTTIASTSDSEEYAVTITATGMAPVHRVIELYRRTATSGETLTVTTSRASVGFIANDTITAASLNADAVTEIQNGLATAAALATVDDFLDTEIAAIKAKTDNLPTDPADASDIATATAAILSDTNAILADTGTTIPAQISALNDLSAAQVNAEVVDALNTDTYAEPGQGAPGATISLAQKIGYLYKAFRNRKTQTSTTFSLYADDAATVDQKSTVSDNGTTAERGEIVTGP